MMQLVMLFVALAVVACHAAPAHVAATPPTPTVSITPPHPLLLRGENLAAAKARLAAHNPDDTPAYAALVHDAQAALAAGPFSVMQKHRLPPSGDRHDYMSLAPYWWPDSTKPGGVPFVRRDGMVNPESRLDTDSPRFGQMSDAVQTLTLAYYFSNDARYARRAGVLLRTWFLDPATRMNPNLRYAQAIPGVTDGRGIGIIDTRNMANVVDDVLLLRGAPGWSAEDERGMREWCRAYLEWLRTSTQGIDESKAKNNHGTWYDSQVAALALFVGDTAYARDVIAVSAPRRIASQITPSGEMPEELARTRPLHYTLFDIEPFARLAELGRHLGVDLWHYEAPNGASLHTAIMFISPYLDPHTVFPKPEVTPVDFAEFLTTLRQAVEAYDDPALDLAVARMPETLLRTHRSLLLYPPVPVRLEPLLDSVSTVALRVASDRLRRTAVSIEPSAGYPRFTKPNGSWALAPATAWTSGFFAGSLWQMYDITRDPFWRTQAERWTAGLEVNATRTDTHDLGFLIFDSFGQGYRLTGDPHYRDVTLRATRSLATRFNPTVGAIKSWDTEHAKDRRASWPYPVIIDNLMNLEMLFWAADHGGDSTWRSIAERHALTSARSHVRSDGSTAHVAVFDPATGALIRRATWQGYADSSVWARGQAWAIYGFTRAYEATHNRDLLDAALRTADWYVAHVPADGVPYWDFRDPAIPLAERDASAAAIAASGLLALADDAPIGASERYREVSERSLATLASHYIATGPNAQAILAHSVGGKPQGVEIDVGLVYADYYFIEALHRYRAGRGLGGRQ